MAPRLQPIRGTRDIFGEDCRAFAHVEKVCALVAERYGYNEIRTPLLEQTSVFARTLGDASDVVQKEMYTFEDRNGDSVTLRPENTAGVARAFLSNKLANSVPLRLHYAGAMFRHERPQKGRYRQFFQTGVELFGVPEPAGDVEIIAMGHDVLRELGLLASTRLEINTLGDRESRHDYMEALTSYFQEHVDDLSPLSRDRIDRNPMRILDSKEKEDRIIADNAPGIMDYLTESARRFFDDVVEGLEILGMSPVINTRIVRGFDYYCHTAFEFVTETLGAQGTVIGGGRYDHLVEQMGGSGVPGVGWAAGVDRLAMMIGEAPPRPRPIAVVPLGLEAEKRALEVAHDLRSVGYSVDMGYRGNLRRRMQRADKIGASHAIILGDGELMRGTVTLRDLDRGDQAEIPLSELRERLALTE